MKTLLFFIFSLVIGPLTSACTSNNDATLRFYLTYLDANGKMVTDASLASELPANLIYFKDKDGEGVFVQPEVFLDEKCLTDVESGKHPIRDYFVLNFNMNQQCSQNLLRVTTGNVGKPFAVVLNHRLITTPRINAPIGGTRFYVEGDFSKQEADDLAASFNANITPP